MGAGISPLRDLVLIERIVERVTKGGIIVPETFAAKGPRLRMAAKRDTWNAKVIAIGPDVRDLTAGEEVIVYAWRGEDGAGSGLYTGIDVGLGKDVLFIKQDDIVCAVTNAVTVDSTGPGEFTVTLPRKAS